MDKRLHPLLCKKGDFVINKNYRGITLTSVAAKIYNALLLNYIEPEIEKVLEKSEWFLEKKIHITDSNNPLNHTCRKSPCKKLQGNTLVCRFLQDI